MKRFFALLLLGALLVCCLAGCSNSEKKTSEEKEEKFEGTYVAEIDMISMMLQEQNLDVSTSAKYNFKVVYRFDGNGGVEMYTEDFDADKAAEAIIQFTADYAGVSFEEAKQAVEEEQGDVSVLVKGAFEEGGIPTERSPKISSYTVEGNTLHLTQEDGDVVDWTIAGNKLRGEYNGMRVVFERQ